MNNSAGHELETALLKSILLGPLLIGDLPESKMFCRSALRCPKVPPRLNLQQKLGHLFEDALASLIAPSQRIELLERNLQLRDESLRTLGEIDFLLRDEKQRGLIHLELATKFYLAVATPDGIVLPGPDARDNYHRKLARLREHQLQLTNKSRSCLPLRYLNSPIEPQQLIFGCLFDHIDAAETFKPQFASDNCRRGRWLHQQDCQRHFPANSIFEIIPKPLWPVPFEFLEDVGLKRWDPCKPIDRCLMVRVDSNLIPFFIAPADYPNQAN